MSARLDELLAELRSGNRSVEQEFLELVHRDLRLLAQRLLASERSGHTLQPTALVNEAFVRLFRGPAPHWSNTSEFFASACRSMKHLLIDSARRKKAKGRNLASTPLNEEHVGRNDPHRWIEIDLALEKLRAIDSRAAEIAELRLFCGLTLAETAEMKGVSDETARCDWLYAESWLRKELGGSLR